MMMDFSGKDDEEFEKVHRLFRDGKEREIENDNF